MHHLHANGNVTDADAIVDQRFAFALGVPGINVGGAGFQFEGGGDAVVGLELVVAGFLAVFMQIDEAGGDDQAAGVDGLWPCSGVSVMSTILPCGMPTLRMASRPDSGSMTRPPEITMSRPGVSAWEFGASFECSKRPASRAAKLKARILYRMQERIYPETIAA